MPRTCPVFESSSTAKASLRGRRWGNSCQRWDATPKYGRRTAFLRDLRRRTRAQSDLSTIWPIRSIDVSGSCSRIHDRVIDRESSWRYSSDRATSRPLCVLAWLFCSPYRSVVTSVIHRTLNHRIHSSIVRRIWFVREIILCHFSTREFINLKISNTRRINLKTLVSNDLNGSYQLS